jgi:hypothetical protein
MAAIDSADQARHILSLHNTLPISIGPNRTRLDFEERYHLTKAPWKWFEGRIYGFINKKNEESMRALSDWLTAHPDYRPDLIETSA